MRAPGYVSYSGVNVLAQSAKLCLQNFGRREVFQDELGNKLLPAVSERESIHQFWVIAMNMMLLQLFAMVRTLRQLNLGLTVLRKQNLI